MSSYDWDPEKARDDLAKHGVSFQEAERAIDDPFAIAEPDLPHSIDETRLWITGQSDRARLLKVIVSTSGPRPRIISARRATKRERHAYEDLPGR